MIFVDGPDGVGKTGYSEWVARNLGIPRLEMRPVDDLSCIEEKSAVFNAALRDLHDQGCDLVIDRGSVSSIVYSRVFDRPEPEHAWKTLEHVNPTIVYLACDPKELGIRYEDEILETSEVRKLAEVYDDVMEIVDNETGATVHRIDTSAGVPNKLRDIEYAYVNGEKAVVNDD